MDIKFSKDSTGSQQPAVDNKGKQNVLLVVLLVMVGAFAYIYFFTGLIKPVPEQKLAESPAVSQVVKQPLPSPDGAAPRTDTVAGEEKKDAAAPAAPVAAPAPVAPVKPVVQEAAKAKEEQKAVEEAKPAVKKPLPAAGKAGAKKPVQVEKKQPAVAAIIPQPAKAVEKKAADVKKPVEKKAAAGTAVAKVRKDQHKTVKNEASAAAGLTGSGPWTVLVGNYVLEEAMATDLARVRKAGLDAYVVPGAQKKTHMNRLQLAEFTDRDSAQAELTRLKRLTSDAFMIDNAGMHVVFAGSYLLDTRAASEKERLAAGGFKLTVKRVDVSIPTKSLTAGSFAEKREAEGVLKKLRAAGVKAALSRQ
jgi:cell division septation protein DedD